MSKFRIEQSKYGKKMILESEWSKDAKDYFFSNNIKDLYLNIAFGWKGKDLSFLKDLNGLLALKILAGIRDDISSIHYLTDLKSLSLDVDFKNKIDFSSFPHLEKLFLDWSPKVKSVFECKTLKNVIMCKYKSKEKDLSAFVNLPNLESLSFKICNIHTIGDISNLKKLKELEIHWASKLTSLQGIEPLTGLKKLVIDTCKRVPQIDPIANLTELECLVLCNCADIESLKPLANLKKLQVFHFYESTNIMDGDLRVLLTLPNLNKVSFVERRHYNLKNKDMPGYKKPDLKKIGEILLQKGLPERDVEKILHAIK